MSKIISIIFLIPFISCSTKNNTVQIGENTFIHNERVYRVIDNEITELGTLDSDSITKSTVLHPSLKSYGIHNLDFVKNGAYTELTAIYRGDVLYFSLTLKGFKDLRQLYHTGSFTINFIDAYGFQINAVSISMNELTRLIDSKGETVDFEYNGKSQMSSEMYKAIFTYSVSSSLIAKTRY